MPARFVIVDHDTPLLLPPDLRDWVPADHIVHFVMDAVGALNLDQAQVNIRGTGDALRRTHFQHLGENRQFVIH